MYNTTTTVTTTVNLDGTVTTQTTVDKFPVTNGPAQSQYQSCPYLRAEPLLFEYHGGDSIYVPANLSGQEKLISELLRQSVFGN